MNHSAVLTVAVMLSMIPASQTASPRSPADIPGASRPGRYLQAELEFAGRDILCFPSAICQDKHGSIYVTDTHNNRIVVFDAGGAVLRHVGLIGSGPGEFLEPFGLAIDGQGTLFIADTGNRRIQVLGHSRGHELSIPVDYPVRAIGLTKDSEICVTATNAGASGLIRSFNRSGLPGRSFGVFINDSLNRSHIEEALNRSLLTVCSDGRLLVARELLPRIERYSPTGDLEVMIQVRGPEVLALRNWYFGMDAANRARMQRLNTNDPSEVDFIADVTTASSDGRPHGPLYIGGIGRYAGKTYALVRGVLYEYGSTDTLTARYELRDATGAEAYIHRAWVGESGTVLGVDMMHTFKCYRFRFPG